jgi:hypothetical protein
MDLESPRLIVNLGYRACDLIFAIKAHVCRIVGSNLSNQLYIQAILNDYGLVEIIKRMERANSTSRNNPYLHTLAVLLVCSNCIKLMLHEEDQKFSKSLDRNTVLDRVLGGYDERDSTSKTETPAEVAISTNGHSSKGKSAWLQVSVG